MRNLLAYSVFILAMCIGSFCIFNGGIQLIEISSRIASGEEFNVRSVEEYVSVVRQVGLIDGENNISMGSFLASFNADIFLGWMPMSLFYFLIGITFIVVSMSFAILYSPNRNHLGVNVVGDLSEYEKYITGHNLREESLKNFERFLKEPEKCEIYIN